MVRTRTWTVEINIIEHEDGRRARADVIVRGQGDADRRSSHQETPESGAEQVTARALADLAYKALDVAAGDVDQFARRPMRMLS